MPQPAITPKKTLVFGLLLIAAGLIANEWLLTSLFSSDGVLSPHSVVIIWIFDVAALFTGAVLVLTRSFTTLFNIFIGLGLTALMLYGAEKLFYRLNHPPAAALAGGPPPPQISHQGEYTHNFFQPDELLGYKPRPDVQVDSLKKLGDEVIYDVIYSIDTYSRRVTPAENSAGRSRFILFFGDSFTFGEGVNDDETLPYYVSELAPGYRVYNYGFSGYGPQQMLAKLQSDDLAEEVPETDGIAIYVLIDAHVERAIGSMYVYNAWGDQMPYYVADWQGNLVRRGNFTTGRPIISTLYWALGQSEIARYYNVNIPARLTAAHYGHTARIVAEARDTFRAKYNSDAFYIVVYPDEGDYIEDLIPHFDRFDLNYLNYDEWLKLDSEAGLAIAGDGHPTGKAHAIVAGWIVTDLGIGVD